MSLIVIESANQLEREKMLSKAGNLTRQLCLMDAVIIDELGYLFFPASGGHYYFGSTYLNNF